MSQQLSLQSNFVSQLMRIGAIQCGQFERKDQHTNQRGVFDPIAFNFSLLPSYPTLARELAEQLSTTMIEPLKAQGLTHLLAAPSVVPFGMAVSLASGLPLVYPATGNPTTIEGAFDFNEPTVLLTDVLRDGKTESAFIQRVKGQGLDVEAIVCLVDLGLPHKPTLTKNSNAGLTELPIQAWCNLREILPQISTYTATPALQIVVQDWLTSLSK